MKRLALIFIPLSLLLAFAFIIVPRARAPRHPNLILVIVDALRADRLSSYGAQDVSTPDIDSLADRGVLFLNATTQVPATGPSFSTLFTSRYPFLHGVTTSAMSLSPSQLTLAEVLQAAGFRTAAFPGSVMFSPDTGLDQGFQEFYALPAGGEPARDADEINKLFLPWLEKNQHSTFFALLHYMDTHDPYRYHGPGAPYEIGHERLSDIFDQQLNIDESELQQIRTAYDSEVVYVDNHIRELLDKLDSLMLRDKTLIVLLSDHGELLYEHEHGFGHFRFLYQEVAHVPLIFSCPSVLPEGKKVEAVVELRDVAPTILGVLGVPSPEQFQGRSLLPLINGGQSDLFQTAFTMREPYNELVPGPAFALRVGKWKYIYFEKSPEFLFDLSADPHEKDNLANDLPDVSSTLKKTLMNMLKEQLAAGAQALPGQISEEARERLRSLGYIK